MSKVEASSHSEDRELLEYYQNKVDELYKERLSWLSKFDECGTHLQEKQKLKDQLKDHKDKQIEIFRSIVHHDVALLDEKINVVKMERENIRNEFLDAEEILKMEDLMQEYPQELEKHLPCKIFAAGGETINNELNIHNNRNSKMGFKKSVATCIFRENNSVLSNGGGKFGEVKIKYKPTYEQLVKRQIVEVKTNQEKEICLMQEQSKKLEDLIRTVKDKEEKTLNNQREIIDRLRMEQRKQEERHRDIAEKYFSSRRKIKEEHQHTLDENQKLKTTLASLQQKVNEEMRIYEKENKAKQTLIVRKSEDFQEDYKAKMRAKERNLQALRDNYEKMQDLCIEKIKKLEQTLHQAKSKLAETQRKREFMVTDLRSELNRLQKQVQSERIEKAKVEGQMREKIEQQKRRRAELEQKQEEQRKRFQRGKLIEEAYRKPEKMKTVKSKSKDKKRGDKKESGRRGESQEDSDEESMAMSDLENIHQQINKLSSKIEQQKSGKKR